MKTPSCTIGRRRRDIRQQLVNRKSGLRRKALEQIRRCRAHAIDELRDRWLAYAHTSRQCGLGRARARQVIAESLHMVNENIRLPYNLAIGSPYTPIEHTPDVQKSKDRSFLDRAMEALRDRYPKERPTQTRLAKIAQCSQPAVTEWDLPDRAPEHGRVLKIAKETGVCVEWLYTGRGPKYPLPAPTEDPFLKEWANLDPSMREQIETYRNWLQSQPPKRQ